jgi:hypothetical protein
MTAAATSFELIVKRDCDTCRMVQPVYRQLLDSGLALTIYTQDDPAFPENISSSSDIIDDRELEHSFRRHVEIVPTLIRLENGQETGRTYGWDSSEWQNLTGLNELGSGLPAFRPGCGSLSEQPGIIETLELKYGDSGITARQIELDDSLDDIEAGYERGWSDGLPVVPPTPLRVLRMLKGTQRRPDEIIGRIPPADAECSIEKIAINAVLAGCLPEYLPVVISAVEAALERTFSMHGVLATTDFAGPVIIVNGPVARRIGMNSGVNALGQGNRANATIGRALQLVIRNMGGGLPGGVDRSTIGQPGKYTCCFAEGDAGGSWPTLAMERGFAANASTVTLFAGGGVQGIWDNTSRTPESLTKSIAMALHAVGHPKWVQKRNVLLVLSPEHLRIYHEAGWQRARIKAELANALPRPGNILVKGAGGIEEGLAPEYADGEWTKFNADDILIVRAGGPAGLVSAIIPGWSGGSIPITKEIML